MTETYARIVSSFADNTIAATRLLNNMIFANMDAFKTSIQQAKEKAKEFSRIDGFLLSQADNADSFFDWWSSFKDTIRWYVEQTHTQ